MKQKLQLLSLLLLGCGTMNAQTQFWSDNFEDAGAPSAGSRTPSVEYGCNSPSNYYFKRTDAAGIFPSVANPTFVYSNVQGTKFWAGMDIDRGPTCVNGNNQISAGQTITWSGINIAGKTGLSFKGLFGANTTGIFQGTAFPGAVDSMVVEYRINGAGAWTKIVGLYPNTPSTTGGPLALDNNNDLVGDGTPLTLALTEISANITATGNTLDLRFDIFDNNTGEGSMAIDNFRLFQGVNLPITLASFEAVKENGMSGLHWTTETETDNIGFDIERSVDGKTYHTIGSVASKATNGNSSQKLSYRFQDKSPVNGMNLYRLAQKDKQDRTVYSAVRSLNFDKSADFSCYPNPVQTQLSLKYNSEQDEQVSVRITDVVGKAVLTRKINMHKGFNEATIDMSGFSQGMYNITLVSNSGMVYSSRVTKQ
jgi:hypothetical protein